MKNDTKKVQTNQREIEDDLLNPTFVMEKLIDLDGTMIGSISRNTKRSLEKLRRRSNKSYQKQIKYH